MLEYVGNPLQIRGAEQYTLQNGRGGGMRFLYIRNGLGLEIWVSLDRAGDISRVSFRGDNMGYFSACGYVSPQYYDNIGTGFLKSFTAGFFTTCGLTAVGSPCEDMGESLPLHGTISNTPSSLDAVLEDENGLTVMLTVNDSVIFDRKLTLKRKYYFSYLENSIALEDTVINEGETESPYMILYHCNMGYPLLNKGSIVKIPNNGVTPRNAHAEESIEKALIMDKPQPDYEECCYYYDAKENGGVSRAGIYNAEIGKGVVLKYKKEQLPCLTEWKMIGKRDYVLGIEPGNCTPDGRDIMRKNGTLRFLKGGESAVTAVKFSFITDKEAFEGEF